MSKTITVIIPTCDRPESLARCLVSIQAQTCLPDEVIVVNDGKTELQLSEVKVINTLGRQGAAVARNRGVANAATELVAFIDDDCEADSGWLEELVGAMSDGVGFAFGKTVYRADGYRGRLPERVVDNHGGQYPGGANLIFDKSTFEQLGGFDEDWGQNHEDTELALRAVAQGARYAKALQAKVYHQPSWWTVKTLLASAKNLGVWVMFQHKYPRHFRTFGTPVVGRVVAPGDYVVLLSVILIVPGVLLVALMLIRYWLLGGRNLKIFFAKWPIWFFCRRWWVWRAAWQNQVLMI